MPSESNPTMVEAIDAVDRIGLVRYPTKRNEAWRYAPHRELSKLSFAPSVERSYDLPADLDRQIPALDGPRIVIVNGIVDHEHSNLTAPDGVHVSTLADALAERPERSEAPRDHTDPEITDAYTALNRAFASDGAVIHVTDGTTLDVPIHIVDIALPDTKQNASCSGVVINLGAGSSATVVETRLGAGTEFGGSNVHTSITLGDDATLEHVLLQDVPAGQIHLSRVEVAQGARSAFRARSFNLGASYGRLAYSVRLGGEGALADLSGLFYGTGDQILDQQITVVHDAKDCISRQSFRGVLDGESTGVFNGGIDVRPGADGTDAAQSNDNLLLSNHAEINTQPRLEILADEVACNHGATVGQLDDNALYYLRSRGIAADEARRLLISGFANQAVDDIGIDTVRAWINHRLGHDDD